MTAGGGRLKLFICSPASRQMESNGFLAFSTAQAECSLNNSQIITLSPVNDLALGKSEGRFVPS